MRRSFLWDFPLICFWQPRWSSLSGKRGLVFGKDLSSVWRDLVFFYYGCVRIRFRGRQSVKAVDGSAVCFAWSSFHGDWSDRVVWCSFLPGDSRSTQRGWKGERKSFWRQLWQAAVCAVLSLIVFPILRIGRRCSLLGKNRLQVLHGNICTSTRIPMQCILQSRSLRKRPRSGLIIRTETILT